VIGLLVATGLVLAFWGLLWAGAVWVGPDTRDGRDWSHREPVEGPARRPFD
jgi:hypothetical protein